MDNRFNENHALLLVSVNVYSNKAGTKKSEAKAIMGVIADTMYRMNFRRTMMSPITNMNDTTIFRYTAQFEGVADHDTFFRR